MVLFSCNTEGQLVLCCSADPGEGSWCCDVQLFHGRAASVVLFSCSPGDRWCYAVKLLHRRAAGVVLLSCCTGGQIVLCFLTASQECCWYCAVQLLLRRALVLCCSAAPHEGRLSCAVHLFHEMAAGVVLFSCSTGVLLVLRCSAAP